MQRSLSEGNWSHRSISGHGKPYLSMWSTQPALTASHSDRHGHTGRSRHTGANNEHRNTCTGVGNNHWALRPLIIWLQGSVKELDLKTSNKTMLVSMVKTVYSNKILPKPSFPQSFGSIRALGAFCYHQEKWYARCAMNLATAFYDNRYLYNIRPT